MRLRLFIVILFFLWGAVDVKAQVPQQPPSTPDQWQLTLNAVKAKIQALVSENNRLRVEYRELIGQGRQLQKSIGDQQNKNEQMARLLKERHGRTDQQVRIEVLTRSIKTKSQDLRALDKQLKNLKKKQARLESKGRMDHQLDQLHKQLEDETKQEVLLENKL